MRQPTAETAYLFRHALLRDAAYELQVPRVRGGLHALAFEILAARASADASVAIEIADHARAARNAGIAGDWRGHELKWLRIGADFARDHYQNATAGETFERIAELLDEGDRNRTDALIEAAVSCHHGGHARRALEIFGGVIDEIPEGEVDQLARARARRARLYMDLGQHQESERDLDFVLELGDRVDAESRRRARFNLAFHRIHDGHELMAELRRIRTEAEHAGDDEFVAQIMSSEGNILRMMDRHNDAEELIRESIEKFEALGRRREVGVALGMLGRTFAGRGDNQSARKAFVRSLGHLSAVGDTRFKGIVHGYLAEVLYQTGHIPEALAESRNAMRDLLEFSAMDDYAAHAPAHARILHAAGDTPAALQALDEARAVIDRLSLPHYGEPVDEARDEISSDG